MPTRWKAEEIALACQAYIGATDNPIHGTDQDFHTFSVDLVDRFKTLSSSNCEPDTYYKRGSRVYPYLRDNVFPEVQKFQKALRIVLVSNPTGVTEKEKENMAVAIHCKETKKMEYKYKSYTPSEWNLYPGYLHLKKLPQFNVSCSPIVPVDGNEVISDLSSENSTKRREESRGGGKGKKAAIAEKLKDIKETRKRLRDDDKEKKLDIMMTEMAEIKKNMKKKSAAGIITKALKETDDEEIKKKLKAKLIQIDLDLE